MVNGLVLMLVLISTPFSLVKASYDISTTTSTRRTILSVFLVLILMPTQFSLAYTCACAYAYAHAFALVKTHQASE